MQYPHARADELVVEPLGDELLVFDRLAGRAHSLNPSAAAVWRACDGTLDRAGLAAATGLDDDAVAIALQSLHDCELLATPLDDDAPRVSRRAALRRAALTGAALGALPVIRSIAAPSAAHAASTCLAAGQPCSAQNCCSVGGQRVACDSRSVCGSYYAQTRAFGSPCTTTAPAHRCRYPYNCIAGTCQ